MDSWLVGHSVLLLSYTTAICGIAQDLSLQIDGPAAGHLESIFRADWQFATGTKLTPAEGHPPRPAGAEIVQVLPAGPDVPNDPMYSWTTIEAVSKWFAALAVDAHPDHAEPGYLRVLSEGAVQAVSPMF